MRFERIGTDIGKLVDEKNTAYGSSFEKSEQILQVLYPEGVKPDQYKDMLAVTRIVDKLFRIATKKDAFGESPFKDIAGFHNHPTRSPCLCPFSGQNRES